MKIYLFEAEEWEKRTFETLEDKHDLVCVKDPLDEDNAGDFSDAEIISVFVHSDLNAAALENLPHLKAVATRSTGYDHIDVKACDERDILVSYVPTYGENTVASHTIGLLLNIAHRISDGVDRTRKGDFSNKGLRGFDVMDKTIGVIGASGNIGRYVVQMAKGIGMTVIGQDVKPDEAFAKESGFRYVDLETLCRESDVVTVHVPLNDKTKNLIDRDLFSKMKKGVVFLNTSRGGVVNERALLHALSEDRVAAAGLDVVSAEPAIREEAELIRIVIEDEERWGELLANETLLRMRNVYVTPHNAFNTKEAVQRILDVTLENIEGFLRNEPVNTVGG
ncbi:MAG: NAD(P)-dependent oxidoreductase [Oceanipulchritudo sp.]